MNPDTRIYIKGISEIFDDDLQTSDSETSIELNFAVLKFKHTIKKKRRR